MPESCAECEGDSAPSPPWQKAGEAPRHFPAGRACTQAVLALGYRHSLGRLGNTEELTGGWDDGNPLHLPCVYLRVCDIVTLVLGKVAAMGILLPMTFLT